MTTDSDKTLQLKRALQAIKDLRARLEQMESSNRVPVAVIGMACRFPGGADSPEAYWDVLKNKVDGITPVPAGRWDLDELFDADEDAPGKVSTRWGGFLPNLDAFDASFFGISPREASRMDPQQRLMLEVAWEAFEDAGMPVSKLAGSRTGVFVGLHSHSNDYYLMQTFDPEDIDIYTGTGTSHSVVSGRISYLYDLQGPNIALDTACSSSLVAVHLATQSLRHGECDTALAGGVNVMVTSHFTVVSSRMRMMAPDGRCKAFDSRADGFVRSEGCGAVVLKRLPDALRDGDPILAVIRGSAINQDGHSNGLTAPNGLSQQAVIRRALENAGASPEQITYVETHGTGTKLGDPIEVEALSAVYGQARPDGLPLVLGSTKTNVGHMEGAAGVGGLMKTVLALKHRTIPANLHFQKLNPHISLEGTRLQIAADERDWAAGEGPRMAAVSAFGWSGTNAHIVLEEAPETMHAEAPQQTQEEKNHLLVISARSGSALNALALEYARRLRDENVSLAGLCRTAALRREHLPERLAVAGKTAGELAERLEAFAHGEARPGLVSGTRYAGRLPGIVFIFPGQGGQWLGMGRQLMQTEPVFRQMMERCEQAFRPYIDWSLLEQINADESSSRMEEINVVQPVLFAFQVALAELWRSWGITPDAVVGHSMGEVAAAYVAGALSLEDAARVICTRSQLMRRVSGKGAMAVVGLSIDETQALIAGVSDKLSVAVNNSPASSVLSGDPEALESVLAELHAKNIFCRPVKVDVAAHSPQMEALRPELVAALSGIRPRASSVPVYSTVTAAPVSGESLNTEYWGRNLRQPVRFAEATQGLLASGHAIFIEINPHPILLNAVEQTAQAVDPEHRLALVASTRRGEEEALSIRAAFGSVYAVGVEPAWDAVLDPYSGRQVPLPHYPWQHEHFWLQDQTDQRPNSAGVIPVLEDSHPVLRQRVNLPELSGWFWQTTLKKREYPALFEHRLSGMALLAGSTSVETALAAAQRVLPGQPFVISDMLFQRALALSEDDRQPTALLVTLSPGHNGSLDFEIFSRQGENWQSHVSAQVQPAGDAQSHASQSVQEIQARLSSSISGQEFFNNLKQKDFRIGQPLQAITRVWQHNGEMLASLESISDERFLMAPALLDAGFQLLGEITRGITDDIAMPFKAETMLPGNLDAKPAWVHAALRQPVTPDELIVDMQWLDESGAPVLDIEGLHLKRLTAGDAPSDNPAEWLYAVQWQPVTTDARAQSAALSGSWLVLADQSGVGEALAAKLERDGVRCALVFAGEAPSRYVENCLSVDPADAAGLQQVVQQALQPGDLRSIINLWSLDIPDPQPGNPASLEPAQYLGVGSSTWLAQELARTNNSQPPAIWMVTRGAQAVLPADHVNPSQSPLWGLGRVIAEEHHEFYGGLLDLPVDAAPSEAANAILEVITGGNQEDQLALRSGQWYAPRLQTMHVPKTATQRPFRADSAYLITGGLGGIGLEVARWATQNGARRLILMGRTPLPPRVEWMNNHPDRIGRMIQAMIELEELGASVQYVPMDVADEDRLSAFLDSYKQEHWPPIRGVFHAAGVIDDRLVTQLDAASFNYVMRPKMLGSWLLHAYLYDQPLDFFVMFSSYGSLVGQSGQGNYAAANAFLDALASMRQSQGLPGLSINWGAWKGLGFAATPGGKRVLEKLALQGLPAFSVEQGLAALKILMEGTAAQAMVAPVIWSRLRTSGLARARIWNDLLETRAETAPQAKEISQTVREALAARPNAEQRPALQAHIQKTLGQVLRMAPERIEPKTPLGSLGLESMMSVEFRNRLEASLELKLSATLVWSYPTLHDLTDFLMEKLGLTETLETPAVPESTVQPQVSQEAEQVVKTVKAMSDEDALQALKNRRKGK